MPMAATASFVTGLTAQPAAASLLALSDDNSIAAFDPNFSENPSNSGLLFWSVDNVNQLFQDSFWYRAGSEGGEALISTLDLLDVQQTQPADNQVSALYAGTGFEIGLDLTLDGGRQGSGVSSLFEDILVTNTGSEPLDFHLFNYTDFDLTNSGEQDTAEIGGQTAAQQDGGTFTTQVVDPVASYYQAAAFPDLLAALEDDAATTLKNFSGPVTGDVDYAFQWNFILDPAASFSISNTKSIAPSPAPIPTPTPSASVPEPATALGFISFLGLILLRRKKKCTRSLSYWG